MTGGTCSKPTPASPPPPDTTKPQPDPTALEQIGALINGLVSSIPPIWYWEHAEALSDSGLDPLEMLLGIDLADYISDLKRRQGWSARTVDADGTWIYILAALLDQGTSGGTAHAIAGVVLRPDVQLSGGRSGQHVKSLFGPKNSVVKGSNRRVYLTDDQGQVIADITADRTKPVIPGKGFGEKRPPTDEELDWIARMWK